MSPFHWTCPFCGRDTVVPTSHFTLTRDPIGEETKYTKLGIETLLIACPNSKCKELVWSTSLIEWERKHNMAPISVAKRIGKWNLVPESHAKVYPEYIPEPILQNYREACAVLDKSPKASATLARRCLQGMIRDFHGISKANLKDEIDAIEGLVDRLTWQAIDTVRSVGNIGAHMEKDVNIIVEVEPDEAGQLIGLIETLMEEWYINRHEREKRMRSLVDMAKVKQAQRKPPATES